MKEHFYVAIYYAIIANSDCAAVFWEKKHIVADGDEEAEKIAGDWEGAINKIEDALSGTKGITIEIFLASITDQNTKRKIYSCGSVKENDA